jgi:hypothetical protein
MLHNHVESSVEIGERFHDHDLRTHNNIIIIETSKEDNNKILLPKLVCIAYPFALTTTNASASWNWTKDLQFLQIPRYLVK